MKKTALLLLLALIGGLNMNAQTSAIDKEAAFLLASKTIGPGSYDYYIGEVQLLPGNKLSPVPTGTIIQPDVYWLVFIDLKPNTGWEHPCRYVFVKKTYLQGDPNFIVMKDSVCPPANIKLEPYHRINRYGTKAKMKPYVPKIQSNTPNAAAGNTYAVIVNGGMTAAANNERYWNDCSFMYKTLRNRYGIPKQNIKVLMSDGTSDGKDMLLTDGGYASSPLDLDDDGNPDIEYAATKANLSSVLGSLAQKLTDDDHLFLFFMDHGGYDKVSKKSYVYMWNHEKMYPNELASYLNPINAGFISMLFGQCNAGGFIEPLKATNRIIATACKDTELSYACEEIPFDEFVYHWISAVNGYDAYGNAVTYNVLGSARDIDRTLKKAAEYAYRKDTYANGGTVYAQETPLYNYLTNTNIEYLRFDNIPPVIDLYFEYSTDNVVSELKTTKPNVYDFVFNEMLGVDSYGYSNKNSFWACPNIWIRNQDDGREHKYSETPRVINELSIEAYIYAKIRNRGVKPYTGENGYQEVNGYYTTSSLLIRAEDWYGLLTGRKGGKIEGTEIENSIGPGQSIIVDLYHEIRRIPVDNRKDKFYPMCFLLYINNPNSEYSMPIDSLGIVEVWGTDKMAQSNEIWEKASSTGLCSLYLYNPSAEIVDYTIKVKAKDQTNAIFNEANVSLSLNTSLMTAWNRGGNQGVNIEKDKNAVDRVYLKDSGCVLKNIKLEQRQAGYIALNCNYLAQNAITSDKRADIDVMVIDESTGRVLGGERYVITQEARPAINPNVETVVQNGKLMLTATNVSEEATYYWYDASGKLVGTGKTFNVPAGHQASDYTVRVEAVSDGAISYSGATLNMQCSSIQSVDSKSDPNVVKVTLEGPAASDATLRLASSTGNIPVSDHKVESGATTCTIPAGNMPSGVYQVTLIENGTVTGAKKFTK